MLAIVAAASIFSSTTMHAADASTPATVGRSARTDLAVTVYNEDLGLVRDTREFDVATGESVVRFEDVAARIDAGSVGVRSVTAPKALSVVEQTYSFDLTSPEKLLERFVGKEVELVESDRLRERVTPAVLLSTAGGNVFRIGDKIALGHPGRVVLPNLPGDLSARPTLRWRLANSGAARQKVEVSYLTGGLSWTADYVAQLRPDDAAADLSCWVSLTNRSGARFDDASLRLVAGKVNRAAPSPKVFGRAMDMVAAQEAAPQRFASERLFEYHLYTLDRRTTLAEEETKQMQLLAASGVKLTKSFRIVGEPMWWRSRVGELERNVPVGVFLEFTNDAASQLGVPLPAGTVRLYKQDQGGVQQLVGEDELAHTPRDEKVVLKAGNAFDVVASRTQTDYRTVSTEPFQVEVGFALTLRNRRKEPVTVVIREPVGGEWKVVESTHPPVKVDAATLGFEVAVPAGAEVAVRYRAQVAF
jgi:hypothetical protein